jgi:hypothetical protein
MAITRGGVSTAAVWARECERGKTRATVREGEGVHQKRGASLRQGDWHYCNINRGPPAGDRYHIAMSPPQHCGVILGLFITRRRCIKACNEGVKR